MNDKLILALENRAILKMVADAMTEEFKFRTFGIDDYPSASHARLIVQDPNNNVNIAEINGFARGVWSVLNKITTYNFKN